MFSVTFHIELIPPLTPEQLNGGFIRRELMGRQQINGFYLFQRSLCIGIEYAQAIDLIVEEIQTIRAIAAHRIEVEQRAARSIFTVLHDLVHMTITRTVELRSQGITR